MDNNVSFADAAGIVSGYIFFSLFFEKLINQVKNENLSADYYDY